uniref:RNase H type-1 domain-containing protein n=1 Tax=Chenopodium quinoa TaxID=63459 RepID=A0A803MBV2_CHEQI
MDPDDWRPPLTDDGEHNPDDFYGDDPTIHDALEPQTVLPPGRRFGFVNDPYASLSSNGNSTTRNSAQIPEGEEVGVYLQIPQGPQIFDIAPIGGERGGFIIPRQHGLGNPPNSPISDDNSSDIPCYETDFSYSANSEMMSWAKKRQYYSLDGKGSSRITTFLATIWEIWWARNEFSFHGTRTHITRILEKVKDSIQNQRDFEHIDPQDLEFLHPPEECLSRPPGYNMASIGQQEIGPSRISIQIDGAWNKTTKRRGSGWALEYNGCLTNVKGCSYGVANSALQVESIACLQAIKWRWEAGLQSIIIKTDASNLVDILHGKGPQDKTIYWTIKEISRIGHKLEWCIIRKEQRSKVEEVHQMAKMAATNPINASPDYNMLFNYLALV